jgi:DNA-binding MarR family transcriptional regulator
MKPRRADVERMVSALFTLNAGLDRARRRSSGAARLSVLQVLAGSQGLHPSAIASALDVSPSLVTRHVQGLEEDGFVEVTQDAADHRSCVVALTTDGYEELQRLQQVGVARFESFVAGWDASDVTSFTRYLERLEGDKHAATEREGRRPRHPRWAAAEKLSRDVSARGGAEKRVEEKTS